MGSPVKLYQTEMHKQVGQFATWLPNGIVELGDIGVLSDGRFTTQGSLKELGIPEPEVREGAAGDVSYSAAAVRSFNASAAAGVDAAAVSGEGELALSFLQQGGFVFEAKRLKKLEIANRLAITQAILEIVANGSWNADWQVVDAIYVAESLTVIVSEDAASEVVLKAKAELPGGQFPLTNPDIGLRIASSSGKVFHALAAGNLHPLYSCLMVREPKLFGKPRVVPVRGAQARAQPLARPALSDLLES